jgi:SAM-dependent methyltransferase
MRNIVSLIDRKFYSGYSKNWDDQEFRRQIQSRLKPDHWLLDLGAGAGIVEQMNFRGLASQVCGVDPDERVRQNPYLDEGRVGVGENIPYPDKSFDIVIADNVLEHLDNPQQVFLEINRVLKPGGFFLFKTPNRWHYMPLIAQLTPTRFHKFFNKLRGRATVDTFPTRYKANSSRAIKALARQCGFDVAEIQVIEGRPEYLRFSAITYLCGLIYERLVNSLSLFSFARILLIGHLQKVSDPVKPRQG